MVGSGGTGGSGVRSQCQAVPPPTRSYVLEKGIILMFWSSPLATPPTGWIRWLSSGGLPIESTVPRGVGSLEGSGRAPVPAPGPLAGAVRPASEGYGDSGVLASAR